MQTFKEYIKAKRKGYNKRIATTKKFEENWVLARKVWYITRGLRKRIPGIDYTSVNGADNYQTLVIYLDKSITDKSEYVVELILDILEKLIEKSGYVFDIENARATLMAIQIYPYQKGKATLSITFDTSRNCKRVQVDTRPVYEYRCG